MATEYYGSKCKELEVLIQKVKTCIQDLESENEEIVQDIQKLKLEKRAMNEPASVVATMVRRLSNAEALVKMSGDDKHVVPLAPRIQNQKLEIGQHVIVQCHTLMVHGILPSKVDAVIAAMLVDERPEITFDMIGGLKKQIETLREIVELPLKHLELFKEIGIIPPKGVLLHGPPGTGKTMLVKAVANSAKCTFIRLNGTELVQRYIGEGARLVRELFKLASMYAPSIIFVDEIDSIGSVRIGMTRSDNEVQRTLMELLNQLDNFTPEKHIKVIFATNRIDVLDSALMRPGRIDRKIELPPPDESAREEILRIHSRNMNLTTGVSMKEIAKEFVGASGAELKSVCTEAGIMALRDSRTHVCQEDFEYAVRKVMKGAPQRDIVHEVQFK